MLLTRFRSFFFWLWVNNFRLICVYLLLVYLPAQLSHTWSDFSRSFRVMISETRILFHSFWFYYHRLWWSSWHAVLALFLLYVILIWIFSWHDLFQVTGTDASCVLYIICSQFITFEQVTFCSAYCACFVALLVSPFAVLLHTSHFTLLCFWLNLIVQFTSEFSLGCADLCRVNTEDDHRVIS